MSSPGTTTPTTGDICTLQYPPPPMFRVCVRVRACALGTTVASCISTSTFFSECALIFRFSKTPWRMAFLGRIKQQQVHIYTFKHLKMHHIISQCTDKHRNKDCMTIFRTSENIEEKVLKWIRSRTEEKTLKDTKLEINTFQLVLVSAFKSNHWTPKIKKKRHVANVNSESF